MPIFQSLLLPPIMVYIHPLWYTFTHYSILSPIMVYFHPIWYTFTHCGILLPIVVYFHPVWYTFTHYGRHSPIMVDLHLPFLRHMHIHLGLPTSNSYTHFLIHYPVTWFGPFLFGSWENTRIIVLAVLYDTSWATIALSTFICRIVIQ